ncbi:aminoglycoside phosphotransferase family protein [Cytobacillus gottheilii]|uniref:aminoglycoside phosphotransferase family protein n=1 Tax=Cytobacillus gottheilii TaxID=859144 RepID=UPI0021475FF8|nr:aminoglycoside phosphotransferase family protein [Cytobacillus gottheilii]
MTKAVISKDNGGRDDLELNRLFTYLNGQLPFVLTDLKRIRKNVFKIRTDKEQYILKEFSPSHRLKLQETFTSSLKNEGFDSTYQFVDIARDAPLYFQGRFFGLLEYIPSSQMPFTYGTSKNRKDALRLLHQYHETTAKLYPRYKTLLPAFDQIAKWDDRLTGFLQNISLIKLFIYADILDEFVGWAKWSLSGMKETYEWLEYQPKVVLHGDVAFHNFLRGEDDRLYVLDFDLISNGYVYSDYLQFANRILPSIGWSFNELQSFKILKPYLSEKGFLYGLIYPSDIFREWNRIIRERMYNDRVKIKNVLEMTYSQLEKRRTFIHDVKMEIGS